MKPASCANEASFKCQRSLLHLPSRSIAFFELLWLHSEKHSSKLDAFSLIYTNFANPNTKSYFCFGIKTQDYEF